MVYRPNPYDWPDPYHPYNRLMGQRHRHIPYNQHIPYHPHYPTLAAIPCPYPAPSTSSAAIIPRRASRLPYVLPLVLS